MILERIHLPLAALAVAAAFAGLSAAHAQSTDIKVVEVDLKNFAFSPASVVLKQGEHYRLHFVNQSGGGHDFTSKEFFDAATVEPASKGLIEDGAVKLGGKQSVDIDLIAPRAGHYEAHCGHFMHAKFGMIGEVAVE